MIQESAVLRKSPLSQNNKLPGNEEVIYDIQLTISGKPVNSYKLLLSVAALCEIPSGATRPSLNPMFSGGRSLNPAEMVLW